MQLSLKWLNDYVDVKDFFAKPQEFAQLLTQSGLEVESVTDLSEDFKNVVVGEIKVLEKHPNADSLTLCQVDCGDGTVNPIVCGATNQREGDKVVVARVGAVLPGNFAIKKAKIRGVESQGMMCSESELGLSDESEGILILPPETPVGKPFTEVQGLDDIIFELSVTPNRSDCLSHIGLAREVSCLLDRPWHLPKIKLNPSGESTKKNIKLKVLNSEGCPRYAGRVVRGVKVGPSPPWLKRSLESVGLNSINNIVDITNFVMLEFGQPLHAFDVRFIEGGLIQVDSSVSEEKFTTLDGTELELSGKELTIRDQKKPLALAGIIGGENSGVNDSTQDIFVEAACFSQKMVRQTSRRYGLDTDSGYRFARGTDPATVLTAMDRACQLMESVAGGQVASDFLEVSSQNLDRQEISIELSYLSERLGYSVKEKDFTDWMERLSCTVNQAGDAFKVKPPSYRWDLSCEADLIEEFARLHGYDKIPEVLPPLTQEPTAHASPYWQENMIADAMVAEGYSQAVHHNFVGEKQQKEILGDSLLEKLFSRKGSLKPVLLENPLSEDLNAMRTSLFLGLYKNLLHNYRYGQKMGRVFETGFTFWQMDNDKEPFSESLHLGVSAWGQTEDLWMKSEERPVIYDIKANLENLLSHTLKSHSWEWKNMDSDEVPTFLHPSQCAKLFYEGQIVGYIGSLHPAFLAQEKIRHSAAFAEICLEKMMRGQPRVAKLKELSKYPTVERDFAFVMPRDIEVGGVIKQIRKAAGPVLLSVKVFDIYRGEKINADEQSVSFRLLYQDKDGTLGEETLSDLQKNITDKVSETLSIRLR